MSHALKNKSAEWHPSATFDILRARAKIMEEIRYFFKLRQIWEVETPLLYHSTVTDPYVLGIAVTTDETHYLQTSPEYAMKRLLAAGSGAIYQICKAFRQGDRGVFHHPEFTMLEWYRPGFDHLALMNEVDELLQSILKSPAAEKMTYAAAFEKFVGINPHHASVQELKECAQHHGIHYMSNTEGKNVWLDLLLSHCIEPNIGKDQPVFLYDFPLSQAALAKIRQTENPPVASRFEVYFKGIELANGFHELQNPLEQRKRFETDLAYRAKHAIPVVPIDELFLAALEAGLPDCSGVALGIDRLMMLALGCGSIKEVMSL